MTYSTEAAKFGRIPVAFIECDMDYCGNVYGSSPCTASIGVTGDDRCYNTYATCQDKPNFDKTVKTYRFCDQNADLPVGLSAIPLLKSVSFASQEITPGKGLGVRGSVTISFINAPWPDTEIDPYWRDRAYDTNQGTFWGKFKARNPFYENRVLRVRRGYLTDVFSWDNFIDSVYVIEQLQGPDKNDGVKIVAKDILKLADDKKVLFPKPSNGRLSADISNSDTSFTLSPSGVGSNYPASGKVAISGEVMTFTRSGDAFTVGRGASNTTAEAHTADDTVQLVGIFDDEPVQDVIYTLLTDYANIASGYIDKTAWDAEAAAHLAGVFSAEIAEPTGVNTLLGELTEQGTCRIWWDEEDQKIKFRAIKPLPDDLPTLTDEQHFLTKTVDVKTDTNQRISTVLIFFSQKKPTEKLDDLKNYELRVATPNTAAISDLEYGSNIIKKVYSRWFKKTSLGRANALADALLKTYGIPPQVMEFNLTPGHRIKVGDLFYAQTRKMQSVTGAAAVVPMEVVFAQPTDNDDYKYRAQEVSTAIPIGNVYTIIFSADEYTSVNLYDAFVDEYGPPEPGISVLFIVNEDVLIYGATILEYAVTVDSRWPSSVMLTLENHGIIAGHGGAGGAGGGVAIDTTEIAAIPGGNGGPALYANRVIKIDNQGTIHGGAPGGGGGGGAWGFVNAYDVRLVAGSGGGGGWPYGTGGAAGTVPPEYTLPVPANPGDAGTATAAGEGGAGVDSIGRVFGGTGGTGADTLMPYGYHGDDGSLVSVGTGGVYLGAAGGNVGICINGNANITWLNTGTQYGTII